jgi:hypothetical protein
MNSFKVKFSLAKHLIMLPVYLNEKGPFSFILDTGAGTTVLSKHAAKRLKLVTTPAKTMGLGAGGRVKLESTVIDCLRLGNFVYYDRKLLVIDKSMISKAIKRQIFGIIGYDILSKHQTIIDYKQKYIIFHDKWA